ncbi:MAG: hypothetical protein FWC12_12500 [Treponema sp.]|nr:hypothetical protein [Treponema sp.]
MKNLLKIVGIIAVVALIGFSVVGCDLFGTGTVIVQNVSPSQYTVDAIVRVELRDGSTVTAWNLVPRNQQVTFTDVPTGSNYTVRVIESSGAGNARNSASFSVTGGSSLTYRYNGLSVTRQ